MTKKEYAISLGLAKPGRGRMSKAAHAAIKEAEDNGMVFDGGSYHAPEEPPAPSVPTYEPIVDEPVRNLTDQLIGYTKEGWTVGFITCRRCARHMNYCKCRQGILAPSIVETLDPGAVSLVDLGRR